MTQTKPEGLAPSESWPELLNTVLSRSTGRNSRVHGPTHWAGAAAAGLALLDTTPGADPTVLLLFSLLHDSMRQSDFHDPEHGARAVRLALELRDAGAFELDAERMETLAYALEHHDKGEVSTAPTVGACWDSDRLNLWRLGRKPNPALMSTTAGRLAARLGLGSWPTMISSVALGWQPIFLGYAAKMGEASGAYLRFGDLPQGGRSRVAGFLDWREAGVSVYPGHRSEDGAYVLDFRGLLFGLDTRYLATLLWGGRPLHVVEGSQVGWGNMGEPALSDARIVEEVLPEAVRPLPDRPRFRELLELWRARRRGAAAAETAPLMLGAPDPEERPLFPLLASSSAASGPSLAKTVDAMLESWGHKDIADERRREREHRRAQKARERWLREEMERAADPLGRFGSGAWETATGRTFSTPRQAYGLEEAMPQTATWDELATPPAWEGT